MPDLPPPVKVSPLIKFFRYTFLFSGIIYGFLKQKAFSAWEASRVDEKARKKKERNFRLAEEKREAAVRDFNQIVEIFTPPPRIERLEDLEMEDQGYNLLTQGAIRAERREISSNNELDIPKSDNSKQLYEEPLDFSVDESNKSPAEKGGSEKQEIKTFQSDERCEVVLPDKIDESGYIITDFDATPTIPFEDKDPVSSES